MRNGMNAYSAETAESRADRVRALRLVLSIAENDVVQGDLVRDELRLDPRGVDQAAWHLAVSTAAVFAQALLASGSAEAAADAIRALLLQAQLEDEGGAENG